MTAVMAVTFRHFLLEELTVEENFILFRSLHPKMQKRGSLRPCLGLHTAVGIGGSFVYWDRE
jgi:hypothetical protein